MAFDLRSLPPVMQHNFSTTPRADIQRSVFDRSHSKSGTMDASYLIPFFVDEYMPGDTFTYDLTCIARLATPLKPIMDGLYVDFFFFACPNRLLWNNWEKFMGAQDDPGDSIDFTVPEVTKPATWAVHSIWDYMGLRAGSTGTAINVNALHPRMYNRVYNEWFRDQNLVDSVTLNLDDGPDADTDYTLLKRSKRPDYFVSCLPWPQKGDAVTVPLGTSAPVKGDGTAMRFWDGSTTYGTMFQNTPNRLSINTGSDVQNVGTSPATGSNPTGGTVVGLYNGTTTGVIADLSNATAASINEWREAFQLQRYLERDARSGTRYCEHIQAHWNVTDPSMAVLQRSEYIGGGRAKVEVVPVAQTESSDASTAQGTLTAVGYLEKDKIRWTKSFTEHGCLLGIMCLTGDVRYQQGVGRMWNRRTRFDYYAPVFAHLGEQEVLNKELFVQDAAADDNVFGYQERWSDYRTKMSEICGQLRSDYTSSLDSWHLAPDFAALPSLNQTFIEDETPVDRVIAVPAEPHLIFDTYAKYHCTRAMPTFSVPGMIDHF
jgi:hypothetical protein